MSVSIYVHLWQDGPLDCTKPTYCPFKPGFYEFTWKPWVHPWGARYYFVCTIDGHDVYMSDRAGVRFYTDKYNLGPVFDSACLSDNEHVDFLEIGRFMDSFDRGSCVFRILRIYDAYEEAERYIADHKRAVYRDKMFSLVHLPPLVIAKVFQSLV